ncbi:MAG: hypothetical protein HOJ15_00010 [Candidatus Jacksonbacteria bacterium]|nr:hypothetical protein [Candidatus Jacksonbacteria bacterium]MBT6034286.1 hypothetical protein [Candidatus Jacksonbacteria bacterium]MBT6300801.1 hypothetical protein [Candidatus Jacksonbacteria bacterium]MBT6955232.1 hypothetical protein [Candidatus Jacksonbacteria bacterium]MBT7008403.1 hypothetical protein [Candidatus Jacksonbacteria bacterium]
MKVPQERRITAKKRQMRTFAFVLAAIVALSSTAIAENDSGFFEDTATQFTVGPPALHHETNGFRLGDDALSGRVVKWTSNGVHGGTWYVYTNEGRNAFVITKFEEIVRSNSLFRIEAVSVESGLTESAYLEWHEVLGLTRATQAWSREGLVGSSLDTVSGASFQDEANSMALLYLHPSRTYLVNTEHVLLFLASAISKGENPNDIRLAYSDQDIETAARAALSTVDEVTILKFDTISTMNGFFRRSHGDASKVLRYATNEDLALSGIVVEGARKNAAWFIVDLPSGVSKLFSLSPTSTPVRLRDVWVTRLGR